MIEKQIAVETRDHALKAISELSQMLNVIHGRCSHEDYERIKKGIGLSIGIIQCELLDIIYAEHPDLNDLK
jgi:hypothetical protein